MAAATAVFGTAELSEMILLHLPMRDLLLVQRVNKDIHAVIGGSTALQRKLFFRLADGGPLAFSSKLGENIDRRTATGGRYGITMFKQEVYKLPATAEQASGWRWMWHNSETAPGVPMAVERNPVADKVIDTVTQAMRSGNFSQSLLPSALTYPAASWRRMRLTQPFATCSLVIGFESMRKREDIVSVALSAEDKLGELINKIYSFSYIGSLENRIWPFLGRGTLLRVLHRFDTRGIPENGSRLWDKASWV